MLHSVISCWFSSLGVIWYFQISLVGCYHHSNILYSNISRCLSIQKYVTFRYLLLFVIVTVICYFQISYIVYQYRNMFLSVNSLWLSSLRKYVTFRYLLLVVIIKKICNFQISPVGCYHYSIMLLSNISCWLSVQ